MASGSIPEAGEIWEAKVTVHTVPLSQQNTTNEPLLPQQHITTSISQLKHQTVAVQADPVRQAFIHPSNMIFLQVVETPCESFTHF